MANGTTDANGNVVLQVASGTDSLSASASGYGSLTENIVASDGAQITVDLTAGGGSNTWIWIAVFIIIVAAALFTRRRWR